MPRMLCSMHYCFFLFVFLQNFQTKYPFPFFPLLFLLFFSSCLNMQQQHIQSIFIWIQFRLIDSIKPKDSKRKIHFKQKLLHYSLFLTAIQFFFSLFNVCQSTNKTYNIIQWNLFYSLVKDVCTRSLWH